MIRCVRVVDRLSSFTTKNLLFYNTHSKTVIWNHLRMSCDDNFVIKENEIFLWRTFYLRMSCDDNFVIKENEIFLWRTF